MDVAWWKVHLEEVKRSFNGRRFSTNHVAGVEKIAINAQRNSGLAAIRIAIHFGASKIILLGYDCQHTKGKKHWHGDHPSGLGNAGSIARWPVQFERLAKEIQGFDIINCSRETALTCFPRADLECVLSDNNRDMAMGRESRICA